MFSKTAVNETMLSVQKNVSKINTVHFRRFVSTRLASERFALKLSKS